MYLHSFAMVPILHMYVTDINVAFLWYQMRKYGKHQGKQLPSKSERNLFFI